MALTTRPTVSSAPTSSTHPSLVAFEHTVDELDASAIEERYGTTTATGTTGGTISTSGLARIAAALSRADARRERRRDDATLFARGWRAGAKLAGCPGSVPFADTELREARALGGAQAYSRPVD